MAIYEFGCGSCGEVVEKMQAYDDPHPACCGEEMQRLISVPATPVVHGLGSYAAEYGHRPDLLKPHDQRVRASRECRDRDLMVPLPSKTSNKTKEKIQESSLEKG